jgi:hypothetical protein
MDVLMVRMEQIMAVAQEVSNLVVVVGKQD